MTVQFLGSGDAFGSGGRFQACIAVSASAGGYVLIDCGTSSLIAMRRFGLDPNGVAVIVVSHLHGDHFGGIPFFILDAQLVSKRTTPLAIVGPAGIQERVLQAMEVLFPGSSQVQQKFRITYTNFEDGRRQDIGGIIATAFPAVHPSGAPAHSLRIELGGKTIAYSGDTEWTDSLLEAARDADLFVAEAYYAEKKIKYHLDYETLARHGDAMGCKRLIITHMSGDMLARLPLRGVETAVDGLVLEL